MKTCCVLLTFELSTESYGLTIQIKPLWQYMYVCIAPFVFPYSDSCKLVEFDVAWVKKWENFKLPTFIFLFIFLQSVKN